MAEQVLTSSTQNVSLVGLAAPLMGPGEISAAHSFVAGLDGALPAGNATFAIWLRDAKGLAILSDPQVRSSTPGFTPDLGSPHIPPKTHQTSRPTKIPPKDTRPCIDPGYTTENGWK